MRFFLMITTVAASVAVALAAPPAAVGGTSGLTAIGSGLTTSGDASAKGAVCPSVAVCCTTDIAGAVNLDCAAPTPPPGDIPEFIKTCNVRNQNARCCALVVAGVGVLCNAPA